MEYSFPVQKRVGTAGARQVKEWLEGLPSVRRLESVEEVKAYQPYGIDLFLTTHAGEVCSVEVKTDTYPDSPNVFLEVVSSAKSEGCFLTSIADCWLYFFSACSWALWFPLDECRSWALRQGFRVVPVKNKGYTSAGMLVPWERVLAEVPGACRYDFGVFH